MRRVARYSTVSVFVVLVLLLSASPALADEPVLVDSQVETVNGTQIATDIISKITDIELGSSGVTVTLDVDGEERPMNISLGGESGKGAVGGMFGLATLSGVAITAVRFIGKFIRMRH